MRPAQRTRDIVLAAVCCLLAANSVLGGVPAPVVPPQEAPASQATQLTAAQASALSTVPLSCDENPWPASAAPASDRPDLSQCVLLHPMIVLRWGVKGDVIAFGVQSRLPSAAWVAIGLSELGSMKGADIFTMKRTTSSSSGWKLIDGYAADFEAPVPDQHQDLRLLAAVSDNATDSLLFVRRLAPCDLQDLPILPGTPGFLIWAYGSAAGSYHGSTKRGKTLLTLAEPPQSAQAAVAIAGVLPVASKSRTAATAASKPQQAKQPAALSSSSQDGVRMPRILGAFQAAAAGVLDFLDGDDDDASQLDHARSLLGGFEADNATASRVRIAGFADAPDGTSTSASGGGAQADTAAAAEPAARVKDAAAAAGGHGGSNKAGGSKKSSGKPGDSKPGSAKHGTSHKQPQQTHKQQQLHKQQELHKQQHPQQQHKQQQHKQQQHKQQQQHKEQHTQQSRKRQGPQRQPFGPESLHAYDVQSHQRIGPQPFGPQRLLKLLEVPAAAPTVKKPSSSKPSSTKPAPSSTSSSLPSSRSGSGSRLAGAAAAASVVAEEGGLKVLELRTPVKAMPTQETVYMIYYIALPSDKKYHIVKFEPIANSPLMHHAVAYTCTPEQVEQVQQLPGPGPYLRDDHHMICETFYMVISPNMAPYRMPAEAGLPMGTPGSSYMALEMHYNNPQGVADADLPGSGFRVYYTEQLRPHDMGLLTVAQQFITIPGGQETVVGNTSVCGRACTGKFKQPVTLVDGFFHMHNLGKSIINRRFRNGKELAPIGHVRSFDYAYQDYVAIPPEARQLLPGDELALTCTFDSRERQAVTKFGRGTRDEMCMHWITYFPAQEDMGVCASVGSLPFGICAPAPPESLQVALRSLRALPPAPVGGFKSLPQVVSWVAAAATPGALGGTAAGNATMADDVAAAKDAGGDAESGAGDAAAGIRVIQALSDSHARLATAQKSQQGGDKAPGQGAGSGKAGNSKAPIAEAASGVGLLLKLLRNGTLYVTMNPAKVAAPYKATCSAELP